VLETVEHLRKAYSEEFITAAEHTSLTEMYDHVGRMLTRWIHYLRESEWTDRG